MAELDPSAIEVASAAKLLSTMGSAEISTEMIEREIADGMPTNANGSINLLELTAWVAKQEKGRVHKRKAD